MRKLDIAKYEKLMNLYNNMNMGKFDFPKYEKIMNRYNNMNIDRFYDRFIDFFNEMVEKDLTEIELDKLHEIKNAIQDFRFMFMDIDSVLSPNFFNFPLN